MKLLNTYIFLLVLLPIHGFTAMFVPESDDPAEKINNAYILFDQQLRPIPAERMIREAIKIYENDNNMPGLAEAYRAYGFFFRSEAVEKHHSSYRERGFYDPTATYKNRHDKSIEYFDKAAAIYEDSKSYAKLTNIYLNMGFTYEFAEENEKACGYYTKSLDSYLVFSENNPGVSISVPHRFASFNEYITALNNNLGC